MNALHLSLVLIALVTVACGAEPEPMREPAPAPEPAAAADHAEHGDHAAAEAPAAMPAVPSGASVAFGEPADGAEITAPAQPDGKVEIAVKMLATGIEVTPAGEIAPGKGHHHIIIDTTAPSTGSVVASDAQHLHFGKGQTETTLSLAPGVHTLTLQFADGAHRSYGPALSSSIKIRVSGQGLAKPAAATDAPAEAAAAAPVEPDEHAAHGDDTH